MKEVFHKIVSMLMAFVVLFSTMSFTVDMHYCGDTLVDSAIFHKAKTCGMDESLSNPECSITKKKCCSNKQIVVDGQDELKISFDKLSLDQQKFVAVFVYSYSKLFVDFEENTISIAEYPPPLIIRQIYKLDETYLI